MFDMIGNIFKNIAKKPATRKYPAVKRSPYEAGRGSLKGVAIETCIFCGICARKCPADAIVVDRANKTWELDPFKCVICGACVEVCPKRCILMDEHYAPPAGAKTTLKFVQKPKEVENKAG
jgi:ech hydrogenase subunit F